MSTHSSDTTPMVTTAPSTTDILTSINNTDRISDFMECIPFEIRMEIYSMIDSNDINETCGDFDYDDHHQDAYYYFEEEWYGPGGYEVWEAYVRLEPQIKIAAVMNDVDSLHMLLPQIKDIFPQRTDQTLLPKEYKLYYHDFRDGDIFIKYGAARILAMYGRLAVLKWYCQEHEIELQDDLCEIAAFGGHRHILEWLMQQDSMAGIDKWRICRQAAYGGHGKLLEWLHQQGYPWNAEICKEAAKSGHLETLRYLHGQGCPWDEDTCSSAAEYGNLETLRYLHDQGCPWDEDTCSSAAAYGNLETLQFAHEHGCPWNARTCSEAVSSWRDGLGIIRYLHEQGCPWDEDTCIVAARTGNLEALQFAHEHGCPWNARTCSEAVSSWKGLEILRYLHEQGCPWDEDTCSEAARRGRFDLLRYAHEHGCPWNEETFRNSRNLSEIRAYLREHGCPGYQAIDDSMDVGQDDEIENDEYEE